jgi:hypothetical protein
MNNLTKEESEIYIKIVRFGNMDDMFDFAYALGEKNQAKKSREMIKESFDEFKNNN